MVRILSNMLIVRYLHVLYRCVVSHVGAVSRSYFGMMHRAVLPAFHDGLEFFKYLITRLLNNVCIVADVKKSGYLCIAKVPYYGRSAYRHRAHDYASPICDATGSRGIVSKGQ